MKTYPIIFVAIVNLLNFILYIIAPVTVRYVILKKPLLNKWLVVSILLPIFIGFSIMNFRIASGEIMHSYLEAISNAAIERDNRALNREEQEYYRNKFSAAAAKYGLWETIPAAVIQREEIKKEIYESYNIPVPTGPRLLGTPFLLCIAIILSYFILRRGHKTVTAHKNSEHI